MTPSPDLNNPLLKEIQDAHANLSPAAQRVIATAMPQLAPKLPGGTEATPTNPPIRPITAPPMNPAPPLGGSPAAPTKPALIGAPPTTPNVHEKEIARLESEGPGVRHIQSPFLRTLARIGDVAGSIVAPNAMANIPGTTLHNRQLIQIEQGHANEESKRAEEKGRTEQAEAAAENLRSEAAHRGTPADKEEGKTITTDQGIMQWNPDTKRYDIRAGAAPAKEEQEGKTIVTGAGIFQYNPGTHRYDIKVGDAPDKGGTVHQAEDGSFVIIHPSGESTPVTLNGKPLLGKPQEKPGNEFEQFYQQYLKDNKLTDSSASRIKAREKWEAAGRKPEGEEGTWQLAEDADGNTVEYNSKTGQVRPAPNVAKTGTHAKAEAAHEKEIGPARDALAYATDYLKNGVFTGPGDEALQEKFFELAKPTTGFRMTQPQIEMLQRSRGWMQGISAQLHHAATGTWFTDQQREQIVRTMEELANSKINSKGEQAGGTDPKVKAYADQFFGGDIAKAQAAIDEQRKGKKK